MDESNFNIRSYTDWQKFLSQKELHIIDDGGNRIKKKDFFAIINASLPHKKIPVLDKFFAYLECPIQLEHITCDRKSGIDFLLNIFNC